MQALVRGVDLAQAFDAAGDGFDFAAWLADGVRGRGCRKWSSSSADSRPSREVQVKNGNSITMLPSTPWGVEHSLTRCPWLVVHFPLAAARRLRRVRATGGRSRSDLADAVQGVGPDPPAPWHFVGLPGQTKPKTRFSVVELDGRKALRVEAEESYGNLVHPVRLTGASTTLSWQWRVDVPIANADLRNRQGDDTAVKVCVSFDMPMDQVPFVDRQLLKVGQAKADEPLPTATVCYVWDTNPADRHRTRQCLHSPHALHRAGERAGQAEASGSPRSAT